MNYVITFQNVMAAVIAIGGSVFIFFVKKWFADMEKKDSELLVKLESGNKDIKDRIEKNDAKTNERIDRLEEKTILRETLPLPLYLEKTSSAQ